MMRLRDAVHPHRSDSADAVRARAVGPVAPVLAVESEASAYVWPLNPWGGIPFRRAQA